MIFCRARRALEACKDRLGILLSEPVHLDISGLGNFKNNVVFANVKPGQGLDHLSIIAGK